MMQFNTYVFDNGLNYLNTTSTKLCICQTEPLVLADCTGLSGAGGKRVTLEHTINAGLITITDGANSNSRKATIPSVNMQDTVQVAVTSGAANLWLVLYDNSRILFKTNDIIDRELLLGATILTPETSYGINQ